MKKILLILVSATALFGCEPEVDATLQAHPWTLISYGFQSDEKTELLENTGYSIEFKDDMSVSGKIDCNGFNSTYSIDGGKIQISGIATTEIACQMMEDDNYQTQHAFIVDAMSSAASYSIENGELSLRSIDSSELLFVKSQ